MSSNDYVKYMTEKIVHYMDTPKSERKKYKEQLKNQKPIYPNKWFGVLPFAIRLFFQNRKK